MRIASSLLVATFISGCSSFTNTPAPSPIFPSTESVAWIEGSPSGPISDGEKISQLMSALRKVNEGWYYTWHTYPSPQASLMLLDSSGHAICSVYFGPNWLGSTCGHSKPGWPPMATLSGDQARNFRNMVGGKWEVK
jgi:hypothetical protein